jgi:mono/diheme cytochrome c family protein
MKTTMSKASKIKLSSFLVIGATTLCFAFISLPQKDKWTAPADADKKTNPVASNAKSLETGKALFGTNCKSCHGTKGKGDGPKSSELDKAPNDFTKADFQKQTDGALFYKITEGKKPMPSFKKELTEEQRWTVINYLRTFGAK